MRFQSVLNDAISLLHDTQEEPSLAMTAPVNIVYFRSGVPEGAREKRRVIEERPLTIEVLGAGQYTIMRTPGDEEDLIAGFLLSEGMIDRLDHISWIEPCYRNPDLYRVRVCEEKVQKTQRNLMVSSSCGLCGRVEVEKLILAQEAVPDGIEVTPEVLYRLPSLVFSRQPLFHSTGASHAAALFDAAGGVLAVREDLGRHNALDKLFGGALLSRLQFDGQGVFISGRASVEMVLKAARARIAVIAAVSAASSLAIEAANSLGITLCGFVRGEEIAIYSHARRIIT
jgi:FdhD protein